jgi:hypothetical protein
MTIDDNILNQSNEFDEKYETLSPNAAAALPLVVPPNVQREIDAQLDKEQNELDISLKKAFHGDETKADTQSTLSGVE